MADQNIEAGGREVVGNEALDGVQEGVRADSQKGDGGAVEDAHEIEVDVNNLNNWILLLY